MRLEVLFEILDVGRMVVNVVVIEPPLNSNRDSPTSRLASSCDSAPDR
jgi:hypothetical protein